MDLFFAGEPARAIMSLGEVREPLTARAQVGTGYYCALMVESRFLYWLEVNVTPSSRDIIVHYSSPQLADRQYTFALYKQHDRIHPRVNPGPGFSLAEFISSHRLSLVGSTSILVTRPTSPMRMNNDEYCACVADMESRFIENGTIGKYNPYALCQLITRSKKCPSSSPTRH
jgi:hypothetical protein